MLIKQMSNIPPNSNPFHHDAYHMGTQIALNCTIMMANHTDQKADYIIVVNTETGERLRIALSDVKALNPTLPELIIS